MKLPFNIRKIFVLAGITALGLVAFRVGFFLVENGEGRWPAAISRTYDYSHLEGKALQTATQERLIEGARVIARAGATGLELGHFTARGETGSNSSACEIYETVELIFRAGDMAVSGEPPQMKIQGPCQLTDNGQAIAPIMVPYHTVLDSTVRDRDFSNFDDPDVHVSFYNVSDAWPHVWVLHSVRLFNSKGEDVRAEFNDIRKIHRKALTMEWRP